MQSQLRKIADMPAEQIKAALLLRGIAQVDVARSLGVSYSMINKTIEGRSVSHRVRTAIAEAIGKDLKEIWPSTYLYGRGPGKRGRPRSLGLKK
mgnify:CR=1 FL=1